MKHTNNKYLLNLIAIYKREYKYFSKKNINFKNKF